MQSSSSDILAWANLWLERPIEARGSTVENVLDAINTHPITEDATAQDHFMPARRYREAEGRFRILGECQDVFHCFVTAGTEADIDPPVYFESCLDLVRDYGLEASEVREGASVQLSPSFTDFLWFATARLFCLRLELPNGIYAKGVQGITFQRAFRVTLGDDYWNPLGREFPAGFTPWLADDVICIPDWGAAFRTSEALERFRGRYSPGIKGRWGTAN